MFTVIKHYLGENMKRMRLMYYFAILILSCMPMVEIGSLRVSFWNLIFIKEEIGISFLTAAIFTALFSVSFICFLVLIMGSLDKTRARFEMIAVYLSCVTGVIGTFGFIILMLASGESEISASLWMIVRIGATILGFSLIRGVSSYRDS